MNIQIPARNLNPGQHRLLESREWRVLMAGGYGSGKTLAIGVKLLLLMSANPGVPGLLIAPTWRMMWSVTLRRLFNLIRLSLPSNMMPKIKDRTGECYLDFGHGAPIYLRSANNPESIDGLDVGYVLGDELRYWPRAAYEVCLGRIRIPCPVPQACFASTPSMGWMSDEFNMGKAGRELITAPTRENLRNLAPGFIRRLRQSYSPRLQRAVIEGIFTILEGAVFEAFDPNPHTSPWIVDYDGKTEAAWHRKHYLAVDPGYRRSAWIFIQELTPTQWIVVDQLMLDNTNDSDAIRAVNKAPYPIDEIWVDPAAKQKQSTSGQDTMMMLDSIEARNDSPVRYIGSIFREIPYGIDKLRTTLGDPFNRHQPLRLGFAKSVAQGEIGKPRGIIKDLGSIKYEEDKEGRAISDYPKDDGLTDHSVDALRYFTVGRWLESPLRKLEEDSRLKSRMHKGVHRVAA